MFPVKDNIPNQRFPLVTVGLILANVIVYLLAIVHGGSLLSGPDTHQLVKYGASPYALSHGLGSHCGLVAGGRILACGRQAPPGTLPAWETAFTALFMHASIVQLAGNLLFLWIFGNTLEDGLGRVKYLAFYIVAGLAALALQIVIAPNATGPTLGAGGAIAGVLAGYIVLYPQARVLTLVVFILFVTVLEIPVLVMLGVWFGEQAAFAATHLITPVGPLGAGAYFASAGGFVFGLATIRLLATRRQQVPPPAVVH